MSEFEELYLKVREKEKRLYTDAEASELPYINSKHPHYREWLFSQKSFKQLLKYLQQKKWPLHILDLGCGNGWTTNRLSEIADSTVNGIDINGFEIEQAERVFNKAENVKFYSSNILQNHDFHNEQYDVIVMAASIQYFPDIKVLLNYLVRLLKDDGEIHILDSHFYSEKNIADARQATRNHYKTLECEQMSEYYYHHLWPELDSFNFEVKNRSVIDRILLKLFKTRRNYFPWIIIKNKRA